MIGPGHAPFLQQRRAVPLAHLLAEALRANLAHRQHDMRVRLGLPVLAQDRKSTRLHSSHYYAPRMPSSARKNKTLITTGRHCREHTQHHTSKAYANTSV